MPLLLLLLLASCESEQTNTVAEQDDRVACALHGAAEFRRECAVERKASVEGLVLTLRAPNGGFRRLRVTNDGRGVIVADGAEPATLTIIGDGLIEVAIADDRYHLPATIK